MQPVNLDTLIISREQLKKLSSYLNKIAETEEEEDWDLQTLSELCIEHLHMHGVIKQGQYCPQLKIKL